MKLSKGSRLGMVWVILLTSASFGVNKSAAQDAAAPPGAAALPATPSKRPSNEVSEIQVSINRITVTQRSIVIQIAIANKSKNKKYLMIFGSARAVLDSSATGGLSDVVGIDACPRTYGGENPDPDNLRQCLMQKSNEINNYTTIEPGDFTTAVMKYDVDTQGATAISFYFKAIVRTGPGDSDSLPEISSSKAISDPRPISINFPLIPFNSPE